jgi:hypothetical protein
MTGIQPQVPYLGIVREMTPFSEIPIRIDPNDFDRPAPKIALSNKTIFSCNGNQCYEFRSGLDPNPRRQRPQKIYIKKLVNSFHVLKCCMFSFEG